MFSFRISKVLEELPFGFQLEVLDFGSDFLVPLSDFASDFACPSPDFASDFRCPPPPSIGLKMQWPILLQCKSMDK